jgi:hypothetical protein
MWQKGHTQFHAVMRRMKDRSIKVQIQFHSGYKGEEIPRSVIFDHEEFFIEKILARKRVLDHRTGKNREEYKIKLKDKTAILLIHDSQECEIILLSPELW